MGLIVVECDPKKAAECSKRLTNAIEQGVWVQLRKKMGSQIVVPNHLLPAGPGVIISSSGSSGGPHHCLHPCKNLDDSALATGQWLEKHGFTPKECLVVNALPMHHVSGLMPWWRSRIWGSQYKWLSPELMRNPVALEESCRSLFKKNVGQILTSLVPTQVQRLISHPSGLRWLQTFSVIWVGGSNISEELATNARKHQVRLAPCYGATETAAMISVLSPQAFLQGQTGCGEPLEDVEIRVEEQNHLKVKTQRLAKAKLVNSQLETLRDHDGWWLSGDAAEIIFENHRPQLRILGRTDNAIHSGGETIFPEKLEQELLELAKTANIPLKLILFVPVKNKEWGERLVALIRWKKDGISYKEQLTKLQKHVKNWMPAERPLTWLECPELGYNAAGKLERSKWTTWVTKNDRSQSLG